MVYKLNIFIVPDNTDLTKIKKKGELFKPIMLEGAKDISNNKDPSANAKKKKDPMEIKEPIALDLTYTEKMKAINFLKNPKWQRKLKLKFFDDQDPHSHFRKIIFSYPGFGAKKKKNPKDKKLPPEYKSKEMTELFKFIAQCEKKPFKLFDSQKKQLHEAIQKIIKTIFKNGAKINKKLILDTEKPVIICDHVWKLQKLQKNKDKTKTCTKYEYKGYEWQICNDVNPDIQSKKSKTKRDKVDKIIKKYPNQGLPDNGLQYFDELANVDEDIKKINVLYHDGLMKTKQQEKYREDIVEEIIRSIEFQYKKNEHIRKLSNELIIAKDAKTYFDKFQKQMKASPLKKSFAYLYLHRLSCYDQEFQLHYRIYSERKENAKQKIKEILEQIPPPLFALQRHRRKSTEIDIILRANVKKAEKRLCNQVHFRKSHIEVMRNATVLMEKITQVDILKGQYKTKIIKSEEYYNLLDDIDTKFKKINDQFRKKEKDKQGKILTRSQRTTKINDIIENIQEEFITLNNLGHNQAVEIQKLPKFANNWRKRCNINPYKYGNEVERERLIAQWLDTPNRSPEQIAQTRAKIISILEDFLHENPQLKLENAILKFENANKILYPTLKQFAEEKGHTEDLYKKSYEPLFKEAQALAKPPEPPPKKKQTKPPISPRKLAKKLQECFKQALELVRKTKPTLNPQQQQAEAEALCKKNQAEVLKKLHIFTTNQFEHIIQENPHLLTTYPATALDHAILIFEKQDPKVISLEKFAAGMKRNAPGYRKQYKPFYDQAFKKLAKNPPPAKKKTNSEIH